MLGYYLGQTDSCQGDSGGPFYVFKGDPCAAVAVAAVTVAATVAAAALAATVAGGGVATGAGALATTVGAVAYGYRRCCCSISSMQHAAAIEAATALVSLVATSS